jgi:hypothetical protein
MQLSRISFCEKIGWNIKDIKFKEKILNEIELNYNVKIVQKHFEKFEINKSIDKINKFPYLISLKSNGNPYLLYLTRINNINQIIFIDKKIQSNYTIPRIILSNFLFNDELFNGTLIDGEMIKLEQEKWLFLINDIYGYKGNYLGEKKINERLNILYNMFKNEYKYDSFDICCFQIKKYFNCNELEYLINDFTPKLPYKCRGIYFYPIYLDKINILYNFDDSLIKDTIRVKYQKNNVILNNDIEKIKHNDKKDEMINIEKVKEIIIENNDININIDNNEQMYKKFYIEKTNLVDVYNVYDLKNKKLDIMISIPNLKTSKMMQEIFQFKNFNIKVLFECKFNEKFNKWQPIKCLG